MTTSATGRLDKRSVIGDWIKKKLIEMAWKKLAKLTAMKVCEEITKPLNRFDDSVRSY